MNVAVTLSQEWTTRKPEVGDVVKLMIFVDEKLGSSGDGWELEAPPSQSWIEAGGITISTTGVRALESEGNTTKLEVEAMVHQPGPLYVGQFTLRNQVSKAELVVPETQLSQTQVAATAQPSTPPQWLMPPVKFGGWNWVTVGIAALILLAALAALGRLLWIRLQAHLTKNLTNTERALNEIANLQKYARSKKPLLLEEWKKFSFELAGILRKYADNNFQFDSSDMTDREFLYALGSQPRAKEQVPVISHILETITEVRYGRKELDASVVPVLLLDARKFVEGTSVEREEAKKG